MLCPLVGKVRLLAVDFVLVECVIRAKRGKERERRRRKEKRKEKGRVTRRGQRSNMIEIVVMVMRMRIYKGIIKGVSSDHI